MYHIDEVIILSFKADFDDQHKQTFFDRVHVLCLKQLPPPLSIIMTLYLKFNLGLVHLKTVKDNLREF